MTKTPLVSKRVSFRWIPDPPSEPTSTLVLTSPGGYFVDIRVLVNTQEPKLQWAFAGTATHEIVNGQSTGRWVHEVDSKHPSGFSDSGTFTDLPNGDALEEGMMLDDSSSPAVERAYEEVWNDKEAGIDEPYSVWKLDEGAGDKKTIGYFFHLENIAQGVVKSREGKLGVMRWTRDSAEGSWESAYAFGEVCDWLPTPEWLSIGKGEISDETQNVGNHAWSCMERGGR